MSVRLDTSNVANPRLQTTYKLRTLLRFCNPPPPPPPCWKCNIPGKLVNTIAADTPALCIVRALVAMVYCGINKEKTMENKNIYYFVRRKCITKTERHRSIKYCFTITFDKLSPSEHNFQFDVNHVNLNITTPDLVVIKCVSMRKNNVIA